MMVKQTLILVLDELKINPRLRLGSWLIIALLIGYFALLLRDYQSQLVQDYQRALERLDHLQTVARQTQWAERAQQAKILRSQLEASLWQANTQGLAQATFQQWLKTQLDNSKVENAHLQVKPAVNVPQRENLWMVQAQVDANFSAPTLERFLAIMAKHPLLVVTEHLEIRRQGKLSLFRLLVSAYFQATTASS